MKKLTVLISAVFISICPMLAMGPSLKDVHMTSVDADGNLREIIFTPAQANLFRLFRDLARRVTANEVLNPDEALNFTRHPHLCYETLAQIQWLAACLDECSMAGFVQMLSGQQACALLCAVHFLGINKKGSCPG